MNKNFLILIIGMFLVSSVFALPVYVKPLDGSGDLQPSTSFDYVFNFTTNIDCTGVVLSNSSTIVTAKDGVGFVDIDVSGITSVPSYLCEYVDDVYRTNHTLSDQLFRDVYARDVNITGNLTLGEKISFTLGGVIDNLVNGWIRITGGLNVTDNIEVGGNVTADWFNGLFNWTTTDEWSSFDGSTFDFNESKLETTYFLASAVNVVTGIGAGDLADIQTYNRVTYNVTEANSDFELIVNFTGITEFTTLLVRHKTSEVAGHSVSIQLWDYSDSVWEGYGLLSEELTSKMQTLGVYDDSEHIEDGIVQVRFYQEEVGNAGHVHQFDWVGLSKGFGTPVGEEIDPLSLHRDGNTPLTANWDEGGFNLTSVTSWFLGIVKWENVFGLNTTIDSLIGINNDSVVNYIGTVNTSMKNYVDWVNTTNTGGGGEGTLTGEGTAGYIPMWNDTSSLNNSVIYQKGSNVGIGTTTPQQELNVEGDGNITGSLYVLGQNISATTGGTDTFVANYSDFLTHISWTDLINGTFLGDIWTTLFNGTMATTAYVGIQNTSLVNYIGTVNTSMKNYVDSQDAAINAITLDGHDSGFFMPLNTSVYGNFDFNGGWTGGGFSISGGDIYAQKGWFYDISSLEVSTLSINGSILPHIDFNNQFDLGNSTLNWRNLFIGTAAYIGGLLNVSGNLTVDTDVLHVDVNNNWVGIGTTTPSGRLNVHEGDFNISNAVRGTIFVVENSSGNVGIGVAAPSASNRLEVSGRAQASNFLATGSGAVFSTNTAAADSQYLYTQNTGNVLYYGVDSSVGAFTGLANAGFIYSYNDTAFVIGTNDSERMVVLGSGNVGIGTASPTSELHVVGDLNVTGEIHGNQTMHNYVHNGTEWLPMLSDAEGVQKVFINNSEAGYWSVSSDVLYYNFGNVGIGTSTPQNLFNVVGDGNFTGNITVGEKITFALGEIIDNIIDGWIRVTGGLNVTGDVVVGGDINVTGDVVVGNQKITGLCPTGWIMVPGNASLGTIDFCVMKYEASVRDGVAQSILGGSPWVSITQTSAIAECKEVGAHLCTSQEILTISRDIEQQAVNWQGGVVGTGCLYGGHMDNHPASALATSTDDDAYSGTENTAGEAVVCPFDTTDGKKASKRTFTLSNGEVIWDWSGNVAEWIVNTCSQGTGTGNWDTDAAWQEWNAADLSDYEIITIGPSSSAYTSANGAGKFYGCTTAGNAVLRGGAWGAGVTAGVFFARLRSAPSASATIYGFRCCSS